MPTRNVNLNDHYDKFIEAVIASGRFSNASEAVRAGLNLLEREEVENQAKLEHLRQAIRDGNESGIAEGDVFARVREKVGLPPSKR